MHSNTLGIQQRPFNKLSVADRSRIGRSFTYLVAFWSETDFMSSEHDK